MSTLVRSVEMLVGPCLWGCARQEEDVVDLQEHVAVWQLHTLQVAVHRDVAEHGVDLSRAGVLTLQHQAVGIVVTGWSGEA